MPAPVKSPGNCDGCGALIHSSDVRFVEVGAKNYHLDCWTCGRCKKQIKGEFVFDSNGAPYCPPCHEQALAMRCAECLQPITEGEFITRGPLHYKCHKCAACWKVIGDAAFIPHDGLPYCCARCVPPAPKKPGFEARPLENKFLSADKNKKK